MAAGRGDVEDLALVPQFMPAGAEGHVPVTTRLRATGEFAETVELKKMDPEEGALFLLRRAKVIPKDKSLVLLSNQRDSRDARGFREQVDALDPPVCSSRSARERSRTEC